MNDRQKMKTARDQKEALAALKQRRLALDAEIAEAKSRLPAHSVKPAQMMPLLALEDEYDDLLNRIQALKRQHGSS